MEAMSESHTAELEYMNAKIASMTGGSVPGLPPTGLLKGAVGSAIGFHPGTYGSPPAFPPPDFNPELVAVMQEQARAASVTLKNILKPPKKDGAAP